MCMPHTPKHEIPLHRTRARVQAQGSARPPQVAEIPAKTTLFGGISLGRAGIPGSSVIKLGFTRNLERRQQSAGFGAGLSDLPSRVGVSDDTPARAKPDLPSHHRHRTDQKVEVHRAVAVEIAEGAGLRAAPHALEVGNDLHAAEFRDASDGTPRKYRAHRFYRRYVRAQLPTDIRNDMVYVSVGLNGHQLIHMDRAGLANAPEIVALQVDEHDVLRTLFGVRGESRHFGYIVLGPATPGPGPRDGPRINPPSLDSQ